MVSFPNAKINIGLNITGKRPDGFHNLQTVFHPIDIKDALEIISASSDETTNFSHTGINVPGKESDNLCIKAYQLLKKDYPNLPSVKIHLHKNIPIGAGLGGGSANGAFTLNMLNNIYEIGLSKRELIEYALILGSDCPFFIENETCFATGRGESMEPISLNLHEYKIVLINPGIHVNTGWAFSNLNILKKSDTLSDIANIPVEEWKKYIFNDFETPVFAAFPAIKNIKESLYQEGATFASMSGTGSTVYGLFKKNIVPELNFPSSYFLKWV